MYEQLWDNDPDHEEDEVVMPEVIHCKNCEYWQRVSEFVGVCRQAKWMVGETGYCVYGKRIE